MPPSTGSIDITWKLKPMLPSGDTIQQALAKHLAGNLSGWRSLDLAHSDLSVLDKPRRDLMKMFAEVKKDGLVKSLTIGSTTLPSHVLTFLSPGHKLSRLVVVSTNFHPAVVSTIWDVAFCVENYGIQAQSLHIVDPTWPFCRSLLPPLLTKIQPALVVMLAAFKEEFQAPPALPEATKCLYWACSLSLPPFSNIWRITHLVLDDVAVPQLMRAGDILPVMSSCVELSIRLRDDAVGPSSFSSSFLIAVAEVFPAVSTLLVGNDHKDFDFEALLETLRLLVKKKAFPVLNVLDIHTATLSPVFVLQLQTFVLQNPFQLKQLRIGKDHEYVLFYKDEGLEKGWEYTLSGSLDAIFSHFS
ncbi:hypothetical protein PsYK624_172090 [Phanerochaete sordida]|uniref:Uncharacterized protein n=1 Tax=Phanerochaete sordida TaxID=48140 RepID=A0A9P3GV36_9APHY|nr:hypothetical protein PsYK624_172090 [Phanerochaete sordida]